MHMMTFEDGSILVKIGYNLEHAQASESSMGSARTLASAAVMDVYPCES
jgi:hypothetical protein